MKPLPSPLPVVPHTCTGCRHLAVRLLSPDGRRQHHACQLYRHATGKCVDWSGK
ncbi:MAG: hypothetical protein ACRC1H_00905 [Caldilineaceae bacterium]